ncbi:unnamed protein product [Hermetia illucens]|uniref:Mitochondrial 2-oxodicarboxylate carrier n=1 Tax=Hermetia illucens TaxID=343691 RepID=A0A7R8UNN5_HERIL|nr:unnamed protein product [Hermetia illucens]
MENSLNCYSGWTEDLVLIAASGQAGVLELAIVHPFDTVRTRMKWRPNNPSAVRCLFQIFKNEGFLAYWKGFLPLLMTTTPRKTLRFFSYEKYKDYLFYHDFWETAPYLVSSHLIKDIILPFDLFKILVKNVKFLYFYFSQAFMVCIIFYTPIQIYMTSGFMAGATEAVVVNPFEVVKITQQLNFEVVHKSPSAWCIVRNTLRKEGVRGFFKGVDALATKYSVFNMIYFGFYHGIYDLMPEEKSEGIEFIAEATTAFAASALSTALIYPVAVARVKIQGPQPEDAYGRRIVKYRRLFQTLRTIGREEGYRVYFKGMGGRILRTGCSGVLLMVIFEHSFRFLKEKIKTTVNCLDQGKS